MGSSLRRVYWDACVWIAMIQREKILRADGSVAEDREQLCRVVIEAAKKGAVEIITSALSFAEVCKNPNVRSKTEDKIAAYFEHDYILPVNLDRVVGERSCGLMRGIGSLKPPDACHLTTAAMANVEEMHTFDDKLIGLSDTIDKG
jgi:predicted nucleic acid-binding protein